MLVNGMKTCKYIVHSIKNIWCFDGKSEVEVKYDRKHYSGHWLIGVQHDLIYMYMPIIILKLVCVVLASNPAPNIVCKYAES